MASEWKFVPLSTFAKVQSGFAFKSADMGEFGCPIIKIKNINPPNVNIIDVQRVLPSIIEGNKRIEKFRLTKGDVLIAMTGATVGKVGRMPLSSETHYLNQRVGKVFLTDSDAADYDYVYYVLSQSGHVKQMLGLADGSAQPNISGAQIESLEIPIPPLPEQKAIAHILGSLDDKIELNRKMNETLEAMAQALFKSWFVDFDPVIDNALAAGNPIPPALQAKAECRRLNAEIHPSEFITQHSPSAHFPDAFQPSEEMGWIPKGWEVSTIGAEVESVGGATPSTKNAEFWDDGDIHWTTPKDLSNQSSRILLDTDRKITEVGLKKISSGLLPVDTVLMSSRAPVGYLALAKVPVAINQGYIAMKCTKQLTSEYVVQWVDSVMDDIKQRAAGTTFAEISKKNFRAIPVIVPSGVALKNYSKTVRGFYDKITGNLKESRQLEKLRDTLLPKLISGELRIEEAEKMVEEAE